MLLFCTLVYALFVFTDVIPLVKTKRWKVLAVYGAIYAAAFIFTFLLELGVEIPSPAVPLKQLVTAVIGRPE